MSFKEELEKMRENFKQDPPEYLKLHRPKWMDYDEKLSKIYDEKDTLIRYGNVYYAHIVQANEHLFKRLPPFDYPAEIVYSTDSELDSRPLMLAEVATSLFSYKYSNEAPPEEWKSIVDGIKDEYVRIQHSCDFTVEDHTFNARVQAVMVYRKHLPKRVLKGGLLPIIACPRFCESVLILPKEYWTEEFKVAWLNVL